MWTRESLGKLVKEKLSRYLLVVVSNREPYVHSYSGDRISWNQPVSGLTGALDPVLCASGGVWIAQGSGDADRQTVDAAGRVAVPPDKPEYTLRRVWLTQEEVNGYYIGFSNEGLWPLCHNTFVPPVFRDSDWQAYKEVNRIFADAVVQEIDGRPALVLVQDYHFALLARLIKERNPDLTIGQFWHIPWPSFNVLRTCPWHKEILTGLLGNDLLGFHTSSDCRSFEESVKPASLALYTRVEAFPISVDYERISEQAATKEVDKEMANLRREYNLEGKYLGIGMDRLDYTKGIPERLQALDKFFEDYPRYRGRVVFIQAGMPSRTRVGVYQELNRKVDDLINSLNQKYGTGSWQPVVPLMRQLSPVTLNALRRLAHFCVVSSLHDGMNLVAKEYVSARTDNDGVLILSRLTGAAEELVDAVLVDPYDTVNFTGKIREAIEMPEEERRRRMVGMRKTVAENNIYKWGASILSRLVAIAEEK
jgi:trehalose-6-phosphate synthase